MSVDTMGTRRPRSRTLAGCDQPKRTPPPQASADARYKGYFCQLQGLPDRKKEQHYVPLRPLSLLLVAIALPITSQSCKIRLR
eukprot:scaffold1033_cov141-Skeletonema_marinoi.AAC.28